MNDTGRLIAIVVIASFAIERLVAAVAFVLGEPSPDNARKRKVALFFVAGVIAAVVIQLTRIRLLAAAQLETGDPLDFFITWLVLVGGADRIREFIGGSGGGSKPAKEIPPIQIVIADGKVAVTEPPPAS